jgi:uncharacterized protein
MSADGAVYLDSSAIVKLVVAEPESAALGAHIERHPAHVSSALARVEVIRAVRSQGQPAMSRARALLDRLSLIRIDDALLDVAASLPGDRLRSLDAIHVASARALGDGLAEIVTYDRRMAEVALGLGMPVVEPA